MEFVFLIIRVIDEFFFQNKNISYRKKTFFTFATNKCPFCDFYHIIGI